MRLAVLIALSCWHGFAAGATILLIGKPRKPITHGTALATLMISALLAVAAYYLYESAL